MDFVKLRAVPFTHTTDQQLLKFARALGKKPEEAAAIACETYLREQGERLVRLAAAEEAAARHRKSK
jgi:hypothetical protein